MGKRGECRHNDFGPGLETMIFVHGLSGVLGVDSYEDNSAKIQFAVLIAGPENRLKKPTGLLSLENISGDIAALPKFKLRKLFVCHSYGAILAMDFARRHKEKVPA